MKRLLTVFLSLVILFTISYAQNNDAQIASIKKQLAKVDEQLKNPDKANDYKLWAKKAKLLLQAYEVNIKEVGPGMQAKLIPLLGIEEGQAYYGKPKEIKKEGDKELWVYDKVTFIVQNGVVQGWIITKPVVDEPLPKAYEAYKKAIELDPKGKFKEKSSTKTQIAKLRDYLKTQAIEYYKNGEYDKALDYLEMAMDLYKYPRMKDDTVNNKPGELDYYAAIFAYNAKKYDKAVEHFKKAIDQGYEIGTSYQLMTQALMKEGKEQEAVKLLEEGAQKYPTESKIIFALIDYYKPHGELGKAFYYIDKAIELNPDMAILYLVKADAYNQIYSGYAKDYYKLLDKSDSLKKAAFRNRYNKPLHDKLTAEKDSIDQVLSGLEQNMNKYFELAETWFKKGIEKNPKDADGYYSLGALYYNRAMAIFARAQKVPTSDTKTYNKLIQEYEHYLNLAREQFEKALEITPDDIQTLQNLSIIYYKLRMYDKHKEMKQRIYDIKQKELQQQQQQQNN